MPDAAVFSNEQYGAFDNLECVKMSFWTGRPVNGLRPYLSERGDRRPDRYFPPGAVVALSNAYGGDAVVDGLCTHFNRYYHMRNVGSFSTTVYPILDDVMVTPMFNQNPMAWVLRYKAQPFSTNIFLMESRRTPEELDKLTKRGLIPPGDGAPDSATTPPATMPMEPSAP